MVQRLMDVQGVFDTDTGAFIGIVPAQSAGRAPSLLPSSKAATALNRLSLDGLGKDLGGASMRGRNAEASLEVKSTTIWLPLWAGGSAGLQCPITGLRLSMVGTVNGSWRGNGRNFGGSEALQLPITQPFAAVRNICNLKRLTEDTGIVIWGVLDHPTTFPGSNNTLFFSGRSSASANGWGLKLQGSSGKLSWVHNLNLAAFNGDGGNTRTAWAVHITLAPPNVNGSGMPQQIEIHSAIRHLHQVGAYGLNRASIDTPFLRPNGATQPASFMADAPLTIGANPGAAYATLTDAMQPGLAQLQFGMQMRARSEGIQTRIVRDLSNNPFNFPQSAAIL